MRSWRSIRGAIVGAAWLSAGLCACEIAPDGPVSESALLITIDTWRGDCLGASGHPSLRTPHLDRFFRGGAQFAGAFSAIPTTLASHTSMLTGLWPPQHGIPRNGWVLPEDITSVAEILRDGGFRTGAFVSSAALDHEFQLGQGFDEYSSNMILPENLEQAWRPAGATIERAMTWWDEAAGRRFLWVHFFEPHFPYDPEPRDLAPYATGYVGEASGAMDYLYAMWANPEILTEDAYWHILSLYYGEITGLDRKIGEFLRTVSEDSTLSIVLTSDHGESLGEEGLFFKHGPATSPAELHVPLVVRGPGVEPSVSGALVSTIDVARTILARLNVGADLPADSRDLLRSGPEREVFGVASMPWNFENESGYANAEKQRILRNERFAYRETPYANEQSVFDRVADPGELQPLDPSTTPPSDEMADRLTTWIDDARVVPAPSEINPRLRDQLDDLGYVE